MKIGLVQINSKFSGQAYLPYSVGLLQAYMQKYGWGQYEFLLPIYSRMKVDEAVKHLKGADVVGFSCYVWNERLSLEIAKRLHPDTFIVFGGPQVPYQAKQYMEDHPFINAVVHGEGEQGFLTAIWDARTRSEYWPDRMKDLSIAPSPYLSGVFDPLMKAHPEEKWLGLWETNRGCPFECTFCDWGSAVASKVTRFDMERLKQEVDWFADHKIEFIFTCDANFGILQRDLDIAHYVAYTKQRTGYPHKLSVQNTKNATERAYSIQKVLSDYDLNAGVTLSMQSMDPTTLKAIKRANISLDTYRDLQERLDDTYSDLILGLPGETYDSFANGVSELIASGQHNRIQFNNLSILPNAEMGDPAYQKKYGMEIVETKIINIHGALEEEEVPEYQQLVVATHTMPREDWVKARVFSWLTALLYFDKLLQIPMDLVHELTGTTYRQMIEAFMTANSPILAATRHSFQKKARDIQSGDVEYCHSTEWLNIYWPADEYMFINLVQGNTIGGFYTEAYYLLAEWVWPFQYERLMAATLRNRVSLRVPLPGESIEDWCRDVVWYGNKTGAYLNKESAEHY